jgi:hypothetical protein
MENQKTSESSFASIPEDSILKVGSIYRPYVQICFWNKMKSVPWVDNYYSKEDFMILADNPDSTNLKHDFYTRTYTVLIDGRKMYLHIANRDAISYLLEMVV